MILIGILAAYAAPKFAGRGGYSELTVQQDLKQSIRFAQQLAMSRTSDTITFTTTSTTIDVKDGTSPASGYPKTVPSDVTLSSLTLTFDRFGSAGTTTRQIDATGTERTLSVCVAGTTGYAYEC